MYDSLIQSINVLQKSKYSKGNKRNLSYVLGALHQAKPIFPSDDTQAKIISFRNILPDDHVNAILKEFINSFEIQCLQKNNITVKNYSLFSIVCLKIAKTIDEGNKRGLTSAHILNELDRMFVRYPVKYNKQAIHDPLGVIFAITELALDAEINLSKEYQFDQTILNSVTPIMQKYILEYDNPAEKIMQEFSEMPKSRLVIKIGSKHQKIIETFLQHAIVKLPIESKTKRAKDLLEKIIREENDSVSLGYYNTLKLSLKDNEISSYLSKAAKQMHTEKRFARTILDEMSKL